MRTFCLILSGVIFSLVSAIHFIRYTKGWEMAIDHFQIPMQWSIYGGVVTALLALIMFVGAAKKH